MSDLGVHERPANTGIKLANPDLYDQLVQHSRTFWNDLPDHYRKYADEDAQEALLGREVVFVDQVHAAMTNLASTREGKITLLLDCDETFVKNEYDSEDNVTTYIRPGLETLLKLLDSTMPDRYDVGLLTSRAQSHLDNELEAPTHGYMRQLESQLNRDFVISSRMGSPIFSQEGLALAPQRLEWDENELAINAIRSIIRPEMIEPILTDDYDRLSTFTSGSHWYDSKLAIVDHLANTYPDRGFVFVDDLPFADSINPSHPQVRGVALRDSAFYL